MPAVSVHLPEHTAVRAFRLWSSLILCESRDRLSQRKFRISMRSSPAEGLVPEYRMVFRSGDTVRPLP